MTSSYTSTQATTFSVTHARYLASKIATDLRRVQRFYGSPGDNFIINHEREAIAILNHGYLGKIIYGFKRNGEWIEPTLTYTVQDLSDIHSQDDDPGRIRPGADVAGAFFNSFLIYNHAWQDLTPVEKRAFEEKLPFQRTGGVEPGINGRLHRDLNYFAGGRSLERTTLRSY